jgi:3D (Asp-Asp-Asp) domain-containing protein
MRILVRRRLAGALIVGLLLCASVAPLAGHAQDALSIGGNAVVNNTDGDGLVVRAEPGLGQSVRSRLADGARVRILEGPRSADGHQWYRVSATGADGWVAARYLVATAERAALTSSSGGAAPFSSASSATSPSTSSAAGAVVGPVSGRALQVRVVAYNVPTGASPRTAEGTVPRRGTVADDPSVIPLGSRLTIEGYDGMIFIAEDTGGAVHGNLIDIWFDDAAAARQFGIQTRTITILER